MADPTDSVDLALAELEKEPLPDHTQDRTHPEDEIEVEYADEGGEKRPESTPAAPAPGETREIPAGEGIEALRARLQASDTARRQAEDRANQAEQARQAATGAKQESDTQMLTTALESVRQGLSVLEANLAEAYAVQDFAQAAKIQTEIARTTRRESDIENGLEYLKNAPREEPRRAAPSTDDQVETVARQLTPNAAAWIRAHPDYITDANKNQRLMSAHYAAMADGMSPDSPDYIRYVEERVLPAPARRDPEPQLERRETVAETRRSAPPPAPVSRGNGGANSSTRVTLSREQRETAHENFPDEMREDPSGRKAEQAYARNMLILQREKRLN